MTDALEKQSAFVAAYETSASVAKIAPALVAAQAVVGGAAKSAENPHFQSKFAPLDEVWKAAKEPLTENELAITQHLVSDSEARPGLRTTVWHSSGEWISSTIFAALDKPGPQPIGSLMTYLRRYSLQSVLGICPEDTDAEEVASSESKTFRFAIQAASSMEELREVGRAIKARNVRGKQRDSLIRDWNERRKALMSGDEVAAELLEDLEGREPPPEFDEPVDGADLLASPEQQEIELADDGEPVPELP